MFDTASLTTTVCAEKTKAITMGQSHEIVFGIYFIL